MTSHLLAACPGSGETACRRFYRPLLAAVLAVSLGLLAGCGERSPAREVVVYTSVDQVYAEPILKDFEARSGIKVRALYDVEAAKTTGLVTRLEAEKSRPQADVFWNGEFAQTLGLKEKGVLAPYHSPAAQDIPPALRDADGFWTGVGGRARVFIVNTQKLQPADYPDSLDDMLDARWPAESVGIAQPLFGTTATHAAALYALRGPEAALAFFKALHARGVRVVDGNSVVRDLVVQGQLAYGLTDTDDADAALRRGAPVRVIPLDQEGAGTLVIPGTVAMIAGAPNPDAARALVDYLVAAPTEDALIRAGGCQTSVRPNSKAADPVFSSIKALPVGLSEVQAMMPRAHAELREVFVR